jgi:alkylated DNA repair dioxygenase AlkB
MMTPWPRARKCGSHGAAAVHRAEEIVFDDAPSPPVDRRPLRHRGVVDRHVGLSEARQRLAEEALHVGRAVAWPMPEEPPVMTTTRTEPEGFTYLADFLSAGDERALVAEVERLPFREVRMHGVVARRTVIHFGWDYDYEGWKIHPAEEPPPWLASLRDRVAETIGVEAAALEQFLIARYPPGATIGWHRDAPMFGSPVVGVSLLSPCRMRFRRKVEERFETVAHVLEPRSLYVLDGAARRQWQHQIPATKSLRYSITMRSLRATTMRPVKKRTLP